jgi:putative spermidine/putrescine transport system ATP-binding protein
VSIDPPAESMPNMFDATVKELIYLGDHIRTRVAVCGHDDFVIKIPNSHEHASLKEGNKIHVGWKVEDCRALDASD